MPPLPSPWPHRVRCLVGRESCPRRCATEHIETDLVCRLLDAIAALNDRRPAAEESLASPPALGASAEAERRQLTLMFCDLVGPTVRLSRTSATLTSNSLGSDAQPEDQRVTWIRCT